MWYTQIYTPPTPPQPLAIVRPVSTFTAKVQAPLPLPLPAVVQRAACKSAGIAALSRPMTAAYAGRADIAMAHFARLLGFKLVLKKSINGCAVALFGDGTVKSFLIELASQLPSDVVVYVDFKSHQLVIKPFQQEG